MRLFVVWTCLLLVAGASAGGQAPAPAFTDPVALLKAVAANYARGADTFRIESVTETSEVSDLHREWRKTVASVVKGPGAQYRIETRAPFGSYVIASDGSHQWTYLVEGGAYAEEPLPQNWPDFPRYVVGSDALQTAWAERTWLEALAAEYKSATMLPEEEITVGGKSFRCYVVHVKEQDKAHPDPGNGSDTTLWIDAKDLVFRKEVEHLDSYYIVTKTIHVPLHQDITTVYPVVDFAPTIAPGTFAFVPPPSAKQVATLMPELPGSPPPNKPDQQIVGQLAPEVSFSAADGTKVALSSFRGRPVLLDFWATWCGPCLLSMPALGRVHGSAQGTKLEVITADQDSRAEDARAYLARHNYDWTNFHDADGVIGKAFKGNGIPLAVLIDAQGKIVYYDFGGDEPGLRKAIAALGPEYAKFAIVSGQTASAPVTAGPPQASTKP